MRATRRPASTSAPASASSRSASSLWTRTPGSRTSAMPSAMICSTSPSLSSLSVGRISLASWPAPKRLFRPPGPPGADAPGARRFAPGSARSAMGARSHRWRTADRAIRPPRIASPRGRPGSRFAASSATTWKSATRSRAGPFTGWAWAGVSGRGASARVSATAERQKMPARDLPRLTGPRDGRPCLLPRTSAHRIAAALPGKPRFWADSASAILIRPGTPASSGSRPSQLRERGVADLRTLDGCVKRLRSTTASSRPPARSTVPTPAAWRRPSTDGRVVALDGSRRNPVTGGYICAKVRRFPERVYGAARLMHPMRPRRPEGQCGVLADHLGRGDRPRRDPPARGARHVGRRVDPARSRTAARTAC